MARNYADLGSIYKDQGNKMEAKHLCQKSIALFEQLQSPNAKTVQGWLDDV